ncbi:hypothetical protein OVA14_01955 [Agrococcus sp. SL85]|uniref:hypothetical protein n=1 Tax=Agrococcus sp. SL85 TaxID=2995141 RepID=UPI00226C76C8|nr:hypothetical protein [Agrococcus sp. SL85]WAC66572.1 hypothetical protein OVA14_01955 [Agrococcus sp. SL85]
MSRHGTRSAAVLELARMLRSRDATSEVPLERVAASAVVFDPASDPFRPWWVCGPFELEQLLWWMRAR